MTLRAPSTWIPLGGTASLTIAQLFSAAYRGSQEAKTGKRLLEILLRAETTPHLITILAHCLAPSRTLSKLCPAQLLSWELSFSTRGRLGLGQDSRVRDKGLVPSAASSSSA